MAAVVVCPRNVVGFPDGGGHFWVYMQYVDGLRQLGCDVYWLELLRETGEGPRAESLLATFFALMKRYGLVAKAVLRAAAPSPRGGSSYIAPGVRDPEALFAGADLLLNFDAALDGSLLCRFRRTAFVDIDPGLLQFWLATKQLTLARHDLYFSTGDTVGTPAARFPDAGLPWIRIRPPVSLRCWAYAHEPSSEAFTTVSTWWGDEWITDGSGVYENNKRVSFLDFVTLPRHTSQPLELALFLGPGDGKDRQTLEAHGWRVRHSREVARTPHLYARYIRASRGEFSCAKPSCMKLQNAWVSDRTLCYLASGRPVVVQDTGPSSYLPSGEGLFRFSTIAEAAESLALANAAYRRHSRAARELAETYFDARKVAAHILQAAGET